MSLSDGRVLGLGGKTGLALKTGKPGSPIRAPQAAFAADLLALTHRIGTNSDKPKIQAQLTVHPFAIVRTDNTVFIAGRPSGTPPALCWIKARNSTIVADMPPSRRETAKYQLWAFSTTDSKLLSTNKLPAAPVFDGLAAADGRLFLTTTDGRLRCFGKRAAKR